LMLMMNKEVNKLLDNFFTFHLNKTRINTNRKRMNANERII
jgi:hypothetical protein